MYKYFQRLVIAFIIFTCTMLGSCQVVKPYQRVYLNDHEMRSGQRAAEKQERNAESYREGASGGGSGKTSGGCGCN